MIIVTGGAGFIGGNIVKGLWSGITQLASWLWDKVSGWAWNLASACIMTRYIFQIRLKLEAY